MKSEGGLVYLTAEEMAEVDRVAIQEFGVPVLVLMENAGFGVASLARSMLGGTVAGRRISCLVGKGNNGGDGLVAARYLHNWGAEVAVVPAARAGEFREAAALELEILTKMGIVQVEHDYDISKSDILVDALLGYNSKGDPREPVAGLIRRANGSGVSVLAVDLPSGLDATTGEPGTPCVRAEATVTFGFPKTGFLNPRARDLLGELYVADISLPPGAYRKFAPRTGIFEGGGIVRIQGF